MTGKRCPVSGARFVRGAITKALLSIFAASLIAAAPALSQPVPFAVHIAVDASHVGAPVKPVWRFFGADEPNYATMKDGRTTLATLGQLAPDRVYFRAHKKRRYESPPNNFRRG